MFVTISDDTPTIYPVHKRPVKPEQEEKESADAEAGKGMWMDFTVNGTANDGKLTMKTEEHAISDGLNPMEYFASSIQS